MLCCISLTKHQLPVSDSPACAFKNTTQSAHHFQHLALHSKWSAVSMMVLPPCLHLPWFVRLSIHSFT